MKTFATLRWQFYPPGRMNSWGCSGASCWSSPPAPSRTRCPCPPSVRSRSRGGTGGGAQAAVTRCHEGWSVELGRCEDFTITEKAPIGAFSWLVDMKLGCQGHKGWVG